MTETRSPTLLCFHCAQPVDEPGRWVSRIAGEDRPMCCAGCKAVAETIVAAGLADYYQTRSAPAISAAVLPAELKLTPDTVAALATDQSADPALAVYDEPEIQARFVTDAGSSRQANLLVEGIRCGACVWLLERHLSAQPGVERISVNMATDRAQLQFDPRRVKLSALLDAARRIGYRMQPFDPSRRERALASHSRDLFRRLVIAGLGMMQVMMYAYPAYITDAGQIEPQWEALLRWASMMLTLPVVFYSARPFFSGAWRDLRSGSPGMDVPVAIAIAAAFAASVHATLTGRGEVWFDSVTMFVFLLLGARYLEWMARRRAARTLDGLAAAVPEMTERLDPQTGEIQSVPATRLLPGDRFRVAPGQRIAADAELLDAATTIDRSLLTGESDPVPVARGDMLPGGAINTGHPVVLRVLRAAADSTISTIERLAERAAANRPRFVTVTDRIARVFVIGLLGFAVLVWFAWLLIDPSRAGPIAIAVLVVSCPCALSMATPAALAAGSSLALQKGLLVSSGDVLITTADLTDVVFDKTGTLTLGRPSLIELQALRETSADRPTVNGPSERASDRSADRPSDPSIEAGRLLAIAAALETGQSHPIAEALLTAASAVPLPATTDARNVPGSGVEARIDGQLWRLGTRAFALSAADDPTASMAHPLLPACEESQAPKESQATDEPAGTVVWLGAASGLAARLVFQDALRPEAIAVVQALRASGLHVHLLSGDAPAAVEAVAKAVGIDAYVAQADPDGKLAYLRALQAEGRRVLMVGDGINDAPVLAAADVSIAVGRATSLARTSAAVVLLGDRLDDLLRFRDISLATLRVLRQNLGWAMAYNVVAIPIAAIGWVPPLVAALGMSASSLLVSLNALRLLRTNASIGRAPA